jgi:NADPH:quinone reductase-like Zn-dependent oxidoreductase
MAMRAMVFAGPREMPLEERPDLVPGSGTVVVAVRAAGI